MPHRATCGIARGIRGVTSRGVGGGDGRRRVFTTQGIIVAAVEAAHIQEVAIGVGDAAGAFPVVFETGAGPDGGEGEGDDDEGDDVGGEFGDFDDVLEDGEGGWRRVSENWIED